MTVVVVKSRSASSEQASRSSCPAIHECNPVEATEAGVGRAQQHADVAHLPGTKSRGPFGLQWTREVHTLCYRLQVLAVGGTIAQRP